ncbi:MAG: hypothetical protein HGA85_07655 [Nanoarchaeota archaeon]|nr:hypothetical protein [Nanoarchaeota archaeon]
MGRNFAIIDGNMFNLSSIDALKGSGVIIKDKTYGIFSPKPLNELTTRMFFEAFRQIKIDAVEGSEEIYHTHMESITGLEKLEALLKVKKHSLGSYGFNYVGNAEDPRYDITLDVPSHILRNPKNKQNCVLFDQTTLAIPVYFEEERITYDTPFCIEKRFKHPFVDNGGICMGGYDSGNLRDLPLAQQVATYILTARQILLTGLNRNTTSNLHSIDSFKRVVDPEDYIHMGIRVTNDAVKSK